MLDLLARSCLLFLFVLTVSSELPPELANCTSEVAAAEKCSAHLELLKQHGHGWRISQHEQHISDDLEEACEKASTCLENLECNVEEAKYLRDEMCEAVQMLQNRVTDCVLRVYSHVLEIGKCEDGEKHNYDFLSADPIKQRAELMRGKHCILYIVNRNDSACYREARRFITSNYEKFVNAITTLPKNTQCQGFYNQAHGSKCFSFMEQLDFERRSLSPRMDELKSDDPQLVFFLMLCKGARHCLETSCIHDPKRLMMYRNRCKPFFEKARIL